MWFWSIKQGLKVDIVISVKLSAGESAGTLMTKFKSGRAYERLKYDIQQWRWRISLVSGLLESHIHILVFWVKIFWHMGVENFRNYHSLTEPSQRIENGGAVHYISIYTLVVELDNLVLNRLM